MTTILECPICKEKALSLMPGRNGKTWSAVCQVRNERHKKKCGLTVFFRDKEKTKIIAYLTALYNKCDGKPENVHFEKHYEGILKCPMCYRDARLTVTKKLTLAIKCAICPVTIFINPKYISNLYGSELVQIEDKK